MKKTEIKKLYGGKHSCGLHTLQVQARWLKFSDSIKPGSENDIAPQKNAVIPHLPWKTFRYRLTPSIPLFNNRYTLPSGRELAITVADMTRHKPYYVERADFAFDNLNLPYKDLYRLNSAVIWLIEDKFELDNNGVTKTDSGRFKSIFGKSQKKSITGKSKRPFEPECYDKTLQYPNCGIYSRLELRCLDAGGTIPEAARRTISMLGELLTDDSYNRLIEYHNDILRGQWRECSKSTEWRTWFCDRQEHIFSLEQFRSIVSELTGNNGNNAVKRYNDSRKDAPQDKLNSITLISKDKLSAYIERLQVCLRAWRADCLCGLADVQRAEEHPVISIFDVMSEEEIDYIGALEAERENQRRISEQAFCEYMEELIIEDPDYPCPIYNDPDFIKLVDHIDGGKYIKPEEPKRPSREHLFDSEYSFDLKEECNFDPDIDAVMC